MFAWRALDGSGTQPHDVLPGDAIGYARLDLDPSATQKINAMRFLGQFPGLDTSGLSEDIDLREWMIEQFNTDTGCTISFEGDIEPWLGDRMGIAVLPPAEPYADPDGILAFQVSDDAAADEAMQAINECANPAGDHGPGFTHLDGYMIVAETQEIAEQSAAAARESALGDNDEFTRAMNELGDPGVASAWISGIAMFEAFEPTMSGAMGGGMFDDEYGDDEYGDDLYNGYSDTVDPDEILELVEDNFRSFAVTFRFSNDYAEVASVITGDLYQEVGGNGVSANVPDTTALLFGFSNMNTYLNDHWDLVRETSPQEMAMLQGMATAMGLELPADLATAVGDNFVIAIDGERLDLRALFEYDDFSSLDIGLQVVTDPEAFTEMWDRLQVAAEWAEVPLDEVPLTRTDDGYVIASSPGYSAALTEGGTLGESESYTRAVRDAGQADSVFYLNADVIVEALVPVIVAQGADPDLVQSIELIDAIGYSTRMRDGFAESTLRITVK